MYFVPDSQLIFPCVFLLGIDRIQHPTRMYKECFELLCKYCDYLVLPSNILDFNNLIINKFNRFLSHIESEIQKARSRGFSEEQFYRSTESLLTTFDYGDLMTYWKNKKGFFWTLASMDHFIARRKLLKLTNENMGIFNKICEDHEVIFSEEEQKLSEILYQIIRDLQKKGQIKSSANESDLTILSDCLIFNGKRFHEGVMYLVTGDNELFGATNEIVEKPRLILDCLGFTEKIVGFRPLKPDKFIEDFKKHRTPNN